MGRLLVRWIAFIGVEVLVTNSVPPAIVHAICFLLAVGYAQNYYFHLRESARPPHDVSGDAKTDRHTGHHKNNAH